MKNPTVLLFLFVGLFSTALPSARAEDKATADEPTPHQRIYHFEHRLLPKWTHHTNGAFFEDIRSGTLERPRGAATEIVGEAFARQFAVRTSAEPAGVLITFAPPTETTECFFVFVAKNGDGFRYITFEKSEDILNEGLRTCVGEWTADGSHLNFGFLKEETEEAFLQRVTALLKKADEPPGAITTPSAAAPAAGQP
jgi:hypothetical protein